MTCVRWKQDLLSSIFSADETFQCALVKLLNSTFMYWVAVCLVMQNGLKALVCKSNRSFEIRLMQSDIVESHYKVYSNCDVCFWMLFKKKISWPLVNRLILSLFLNVKGRMQGR